MSDAVDPGPLALHDPQPTLNSPQIVNEPRCSTAYDNARFLSLDKYISFALLVLRRVP